ncbi:GNAT family N-acetyltransferase [Salicibibacter cibarius]|uniref:GNAT family N-acetyltransferase n=1 Tax=Salicibibacter cibarius TaxID=2743000 RepID=A0A7T6Z7W7_9BACI|nr:GNAT family protein [Salicibibacter cibarius]QQK78426.1 GNAT family N-acetyltransferase [Salicibibacter cibarius]
MKEQESKIMLREPTNKDLSEIYYWKYEEEKQEAKKWNGPYIEEPHLTKDEFHQSFQNINKGEVPSLLVVKVDGEFMGTLNSYWVDKNTDWLEIGIVIYNPEFWNGGYGTKAFRMWVDYLFNHTSLHRLGISTWSGNDRMMQVARKVGMVEEARIREARIVDGQRYDAIKMGILRNEWENQ